MKNFEYSNRQLLPRWLPFSQLKAISPLNSESINKMNQTEKANFIKLKSHWDMKKTVPLAVELIVLNHIFDMTDDFYYKEAMDYLIDKHKEEFDTNVFLQEILGKNKKTIKYEQNIAILKRESINNVNNCTVWTDLAYFYSILGQQKKAIHCMKIADALYSKDIFSLRSMIKYYLLSKDVDKALWLIYRNDELKNAPESISMEISICEAYRLKSKLLKKGSSLIKNMKISNFSENELFATMATLEFNNGNSKKGMKLFKEALRYPNENIIAQIRYITNKFNKFIDLSQIQIPCRYEADSWIAYNKGTFEEVIKNTHDWFYFQPFSSTPAIMNSYINSLIFQNEVNAIDIAEKALCISKNNFSLQNNLVVSLYRNNNISEANQQIKILKQISSIDDTDRIVLLATEGLSSYRNNEYVKGKEKYQEAIDKFRKKKDTERECRALYYWSCELKNINDNYYIDLLNKSNDLAEKYNYKDIKAAILRNFKFIEKGFYP